MLKLKCVRCPLGCSLKIIKKDGEVVVEGNRCPRGREFAIQEMENPMRILTTSVKVKGGKLPLVSVKTSSEIPLKEVFRVMEFIRKLEVEAPVEIGDVLAENVLGLGVDLVATRRCPRDERGA